jgi:hypothetical protein
MYRAVIYYTTEDLKTSRSCSQIFRHQIVTERTTSRVINENTQGSSSV